MKIDKKYCIALSKPFRMSLLSISYGVYALPVCSILKSNWLNFHKKFSAFRLNKMHSCVHSHGSVVHTPPHTNSIIGGPNQKKINYFIFRIRCDAIFINIICVFFRVLLLLFFGGPIRKHMHRLHHFPFTYTHTHIYTYA